MAAKACSAVCVPTPEAGAPTVRTDRGGDQAAIAIRADRAGPGDDLGIQLQRGGFLHWGT